MALLHESSHCLLGFAVFPLSFLPSFCSSNFEFSGRFLVAQNRRPWLFHLSVGNGFGSDRNG
jgi:hypothetical protein